MVTKVSVSSSRADGVKKLDTLELNDLLSTELAVFPTMPKFPVITGTVAAGSTVTDATLIAAAGIVPVTGADGTKGVALPASGQGSVVFVFNQSGSILKLYPLAVGTLNDGSTGAALSIAAHSCAVVVAITDTAWRSIPLLPS